MTCDGRAPIASVNELTVRWAAAACRGTESVVLSGAGGWPLLAFLAAGAAGAADPGRRSVPPAWRRWWRRNP